jgi:hypothetical protein
MNKMAAFPSIFSNWFLASSFCHFQNGKASLIKTFKAEFVIRRWASTPKRAEGSEGVVKGER